MVLIIHCSPDLTRTLLTAGDGAGCGRRNFMKKCDKKEPMCRVKFDYDDNICYNAIKKGIDTHGKQSFS